MNRAQYIFDKVIREGETAIDEFILTRESESLFLDFKRSADNGSKQRLNQIDRKNLARAISGFGNSEGGVIVWGVDCSQDVNGADVAHTKVLIQNPKRFVSWLQGVVSGCTVPPHSGVQNEAIVKKGKAEGYVVTHIPKSDDAPHQVIAKGRGEYRYYIRAGSDFVPVPHAVLAGMFGRRPQPTVFYQFASEPAKFLIKPIENKTILEFRLGFMIKNKGPGIASDLFMNVTLLSLPGDNCNLEFDEPDPHNWHGQFLFGRHISAISTKDYRLAPKSWAIPFSMRLELAPPFSKPLRIDGTCGCSRSPAKKFQLENDYKAIEKLYNESYEKWRKESFSEEEARKLVNYCLNLDVVGRKANSTP